MRARGALVLARRCFPVGYNFSLLWGGTRSQEEEEEEEGRGYIHPGGIDGNYPLVITTVTVVITITPFLGYF